MNTICEATCSRFYKASISQSSFPEYAIDKSIYIHGQSERASNHQNILLTKAYTYMASSPRAASAEMIGFIFSKRFGKPRTTRTPGTCIHGQQPTCRIDRNLKCVPYAETANWRSLESQRLPLHTHMSRRPHQLFGWTYPIADVTVWWRSALSAKAEERSKLQVRRSNSVPH